jgi:hypothetical protein
MITYIYQLKFPSQAEWEQFKEQLTDNPAIITIVELGTLSEGGTYDNEGNVVEEPVIYEGYHVDIKTSELLPIPNEFITAPTNPKHGERWKAGCVVVQPAPEPPNDTWLKAEIQTYLTNNGIEWKQSWTKAQLLAAV